MYFSRVGGCSTYLPSSTESFVSGKSRGSTASTTAGTATRIIRCAVKKFQFLNRLQSRWSRMSGFTTWSNSLFMGLSQSGRILLWLQWSAIVIVDGLAGLALLTYFREFYCCKFIGCLLSLNIIWLKQKQHKIFLFSPLKTNRKCCIISSWSGGIAKVAQLGGAWVNLPLFSLSLFSEM